jgi:hypothetical protein
MSVYAMKPTFTDRESYLAWRGQWKKIYNALSQRIRLRKHAVKHLQRSACATCQGSGMFVMGDKTHNCVCGGQSGKDAAKAQKDLFLMRRDATKLLTLLDEAKLRRDRIIAMCKSIDEQPFPLDVGLCSKIDFHFNKVSIEFPYMPHWTVKAKGKTFYVWDFESDIGFSTVNKDEGNTRGLLRFRRGNLRIDEQGVAHLTPNP